MDLHNPHSLNMPRIVRLPRLRRAHLAMVRPALDGAVLVDARGQRSRGGRERARANGRGAVV